MHPEIDRYAHLDSLLHRWDPRWKLAALSLLLFSIAAAPPPAAQAPRWDRDVPHALFALGASLLLVELSRIPISFALRRVRAAAVFLLIFILIYPLGSPADWSAGFQFSRERLLAACVIAVRALSIILLVFPMFGTSRFDATMKALRDLRAPGAFVQLTVFAYRYIYVHAGELARMRTAMRARGFRNRPVLHALRTAGNLVGMLLVRSMDRTRRIHEAMIARGYSGVFRTFHDFSTRPRDVLKAAAVAAAAAGLAGFWLLS